MQSKVNCPLTIPNVITVIFPIITFAKFQTFANLCSVQSQVTTLAVHLLSLSFNQLYLPHYRLCVLVFF